MEIIQKRERVTVKEYGLKWEGKGGSGFSFNCDINGVVDEFAMYPAGLENLALCRAGKMEGYTGPTIATYSHTYTDHAVGLCKCGEKVTLSGSTNTCKCGTDYNNSGQRLAPREQWGEEAGESISDILSINLMEDYNFMGIGKPTNL
jgi:hypothetical protein